MKSSCLPTTILLLLALVKTAVAQATIKRNLKGLVFNEANGVYYGNDPEGTHETTSEGHLVGHIEEDGTVVINQTLEEQALKEQTENEINPPPALDEQELTSEVWYQKDKSKPSNNNPPPGSNNEEEETHETTDHIVGHIEEDGKVVLDTTLDEQALDEQELKEEPDQAPAEAPSSQINTAPSNNNPTPAGSGHHKDTFYEDEEETVLAILIGSFLASFVGLSIFLALLWRWFKERLQKRGFVPADEELCFYNGNKSSGLFGESWSYNDIRTSEFLPRLSKDSQDTDESSDNSGSLDSSRDNNDQQLGDESERYWEEGRNPRLIFKGDKTLVLV